MRATIEIKKNEGQLLILARLACFPKERKRKRWRRKKFNCRLTTTIWFTLVATVNALPTCQ